MGACILCGKSAGPFYSLHKQCYSHYETSKQEITNQIRIELGGKDSAQLAADIKQKISKYNFVDDANKRILNRSLEYFASECIDVSRITLTEIEQWNHLVDALSPDESLFVNSHFMAQQYNLPALHHLNNSNLPERNRHPANYSILLKNQETLWWCFDSCEIEQDSPREDNQQWSVLTQVMSTLFRGKQKPKLIKHTLAEGSLLVTDKRIYFDSSHYSDQLEYHQIYSVTPGKNGVRVQSKVSSAKPRTYVCEDARLLYAFIKFALALSR